nr:YccF domain-containing protein [Bacteroidota bacterium]
MNTLGNLIWLIFGGFLIALEYVIASLLLMITIVGIPFGVQTLKLATLALWPFGKTAVSRPATTGCLYTIMNIIWIFIGGIWIALTHVAFGLLLFITILGIPFARQHFKLATLALTPFGKDIVDVR